MDDAGAAVGGTRVARRTMQAARRAGGLMRPPGHRQVRTFISLTTANQTEALLSMVGTVVLIRVAGTEVAGKVFLAQALSSVWFTFWDPKLEDAAQRFVPVHQAKARGHGTWLFVRLLRLDVAVGLVFALFGVAAVALAHVSGRLAANETAFLALAVAAGGVTAAGGTASAGFAAVGRLDRLCAFRLVAAAFSFVVTVTALLAGGPLAFLSAGVVTGMVTTAVLAISAGRAVAQALGPPPTERIRAPEGIVRFSILSSTATSVAAASDRGLLALAGLLGGPSLVTYLKVACAAARLYAGFVNAATVQVFPRLASAAVLGSGATIRRDAMRATALLALLGSGLVGVMYPLAGTVIGLLYGPAFAWLGHVAVLYLAAACLRGAVMWGKVLPLALGRAGIKLACVSGEAVAVLGVMVVVTSCTGSAARALPLLGWGDVAVAAAVVLIWLILLHSCTARVDGGARP